MGDFGLLQYVAFKGDNGKYLGFFLDDENRGFLKFGYDDLSSPYVKHEVVRDPTNESNQVHIKCCYNNKFWRRHASNHWWIFAGADSINTDLSSWSCTLFEAKVVDSNKASLRSMQLKKFAARWGIGETNKLHNCLYAGDDKPQDRSVMIYYDLGFLVSLPKYVAFKGDNGMYLAAFETESHEYLQFNTDDIGSGLVRHEVVPVGDGTVRVKCLHWNKFWRRSPNWIWADTLNYDSSNKDLLFQPVRGEDEQTVALRCLGNNWFCKRLTTEGKTDCLNAGTVSLERTAILRVVEPIVKRRVHSVKYQMDTAHIYDLEPLVLFTATVPNNSEQPTTLQVSFAYAEKKSTSWKSAVSFATGIKTTFEAGIPFVGDAKVEISAQLTLSEEWGRTTETQMTVTGAYPAPVKAGQTVKLMVKGTSAKCDVKFSYVQEDTLTTGDTVQVPRDDGVFNGVNYADIQFETQYS